MAEPLLQGSGDQKPILLHQVFESQVDTHPTNVAVVFDGRETTYSQLDMHANRIARHLRARGVGPRSIVAILLPRSVGAYATILGILKAGAAYVPIDLECPPDRISYVLEDSEAEVLVSTSDYLPDLPDFDRIIVLLDRDRTTIQLESSDRLHDGEAGVGPGDVCYIIYTSGSTGRPKGVQIEHRNACNLVLAEEEIFRVQPEDRVCQAASLAFDLSIEEIWLAFRAGARLIVASPEISHDGPGLASFLAKQGATVFSTVPSMLSTLDEDVPSLRLIILGGESCPEWLVRRWARQGRRIVNTYGPTETTVIATYSDLEPGRPVTIGTAVPGYTVKVLDESLHLVGLGCIGEICIGGQGVARGYVKLPEETRARFVPDTSSPTSPRGIMYRTGDLGRFNGDGHLEFLGRLDDQVKLRGFRIELSEVESVLMQDESVLAAACKVREDSPGIRQLVGYLVPREGHEVDEEQIRKRLRDQLPAFMVPALIETVPSLPRLPNGKLDRSSLPPPRPRASKEMGRVSETERKIADLWNSLFHPLSVSIDDDFFLDLGGHSLLAARMVSELRKDHEFAEVSVADVYRHPTVRLLARTLDDRRSPPQISRPVFLEPMRNGERVEGVGNRHVLAGLVQTVSLYFVFGFAALEWVTPYLVFFLLYLTGHSTLVSAEWALVSAIAIFPTLLILGIAAKWLILGRIRPGRYALWGGYYLRWWFVQALLSSVPLDYLVGTPLLPLVYRLLGARIGKNVHLETENIDDFDLVSVGDNATIDEDASLLCHSVENGQLILGHVRVGKGCFVGQRSVLRDGTVMEEGARLEDLSLLPRGARIPHGETWAGSPARYVPKAEVSIPVPIIANHRAPRGISLVYGVLVLLLPILLLATIVPGVVILLRINPLAQPLTYLLAVPAVGISFVILLMTEVVLFKWLLLGRIRPGRYPVHGSFYIRNWIFDQMQGLSLDLVAPLRATIYLAPWYRALGAKIGRSVELSTAATPTPDLLDLQDGATIADEASLGAPRVEGGWMTVAPTRLGRRAFVGNSAVVPAGTSMADGSLCGVLSLAPARPEDAARPGASWLGSPPLLLPRREQSTPFSDQSTYHPTKKARLIRAAIEVFRVTLPPAGFIVVTTAVLQSTILLWHNLGLARALLLLPVVYAAACTGVALGVVIAKWIIMGRYKPFVRPLWTTFVWRLEFVNALYEFLATPLVLGALQGTPLFPAYLRLLGARIGRGVYLNTTGLLEWDLVEVGDRAAINDDSVLQTHLFEDRVLKASRLHVGSDCTIGAGSVVLYDSGMEDGAELDAISLLMKGETLRAGTKWMGIPATRSRDEVEIVVRTK